MPTRSQTSDEVQELIAILERLNASLAHEIHKTESLRSNSESLRASMSTVMDASRTTIKYTQALLAGPARREQLEIEGKFQKARALKDRENFTPPRT